MLFKWFPWKFIIRRFAKSKGFLDPISILSHIRRFAQPSEISEPIELLRAGVILHARGLVNSRAIQQNLDWIWPYWVERQFDPRDISFVPRAFSLTHINVTHRNWTAVGLPDCSLYPIVDPSGLVTPIWNSWSIDFWIYEEGGEFLRPSKFKEVPQRLNYLNELSVSTLAKTDNLKLFSLVKVDQKNNAPQCRIKIKATSNKPAWLVASVRPYNPEGVSFINNISFSDGDTWNINHKNTVKFNQKADRHLTSDYHNGDVSLKLNSESTSEKIKCKVGMATAAAMFKIQPDEDKNLEVSIPLLKEKKVKYCHPTSWRENINESCSINIPNKKIQYLFENAKRTVVLHSPEEIYPGPFTYKRFWFRDAAFILNSLLLMGQFKRAQKVINAFPNKQSINGYFHSQEGEWDSNGQVLWILDKYHRFTNTKPSIQWCRYINKAGNWIINKRVKSHKDDLHAGLLPAGFSAEHLGPNDYYYWDDFWSAAGLKSAADLLKSNYFEEESKIFKEQSEDLLNSIGKSIQGMSERLGTKAIPASPYRRMDSGAVGSISAAYPLGLYPSDDIRMKTTVDYLIDNCLVEDGFFHDMIHSGINPYLTLQLAQLLMQNSDERYRKLVAKITELASATGQWPEAVHPATKGGCMGDGQHIWAASEYISMIRNCLVYEIPDQEKIILGKGIYPDWLKENHLISIKNAYNFWGKLSYSLKPENEKIIFEFESKWHDKMPEVILDLPGLEEIKVNEESSHLEIPRIK